MAVRWRCRLCSMRGFEGVDGWTRHMNAVHSDNGRFGAQVSFGFTGDYSSKSGGYMRYARPVVADSPNFPTPQPNPQKEN